MKLTTLKYCSRQTHSLSLSECEGQGSSVNLPGNHETLRDALVYKRVSHALR